MIIRINTNSTSYPPAISTGIAPFVINNPINLGYYPGTIRPRVFNDFSLYSSFEELYSSLKRRFGLCASDFTKTFVNFLNNKTVQFGKELVEGILTSPKEDFGVLRDAAFSFRYDTGYYVRHLPFSGVWKVNDDSCVGLGPFNLAQFKWKIPSSEVFRNIAESHGVDLSARNVVQTQDLMAGDWIQSPQTYWNFIPFDNHPEGIYNHWPLGHPICSYNFFNRFGYSFDVLEFFYDGQIILLCRTVQQHYNNGLFSPRWELIAPPYDEILYNRHLLDANPEHQLLLFDDVFLAANINLEGAITLWLGDYATMKISKLTALEGRKSVAYVFDQYNPTSMQYGAKLLEKADHLKIDVKLYRIKGHNAFSITSNNGLGVMKLSSAQFQNQRQDLTRYLSNKSFIEMSRSDYYESAERLHGLKFDNVSALPVSLTLSISDLKRIPKTCNFKVYPLCEAKHLNILYARPKVGKTLFCLDIALMVAAGELFGQGRFFAPSPEECLYVATELFVEKYGERISLLSQLYNNQELLNMNFRLFSLKDKGVKLNLLDEKDQKLFEEQIGTAKFIIIDNLSGVLSPYALTNPTPWRAFLSWLNLLMENLDLTVILVDHSNREGDHPMGTTFKERDVDLIMSLQRPQDCPEDKTELEVHFDLPRDLHGEQCTSFLVEYQTTNGIMKRFVTNLDKTELLPSWMVSVWEKKHYDLSDLQVLMLTKMRVYGKSVAGDFKGGKGRSSSSITRSLTTLVNHGLAEMVGSGSDAYYMPTATKPLDKQQE